MRKLTLGDRSVEWIERYCCIPTSGEQRGKPVVLSDIERTVVLRIYDGKESELPVTGPLASYLVLHHLVGPMNGADVPDGVMRPDTFTLWSAAGPHLRKYLKREGESIACPELGSSYPPRAA